MAAFTIDQRWIDLITILGVFVSILGFLYVTYQLFHRYKGLRWILRIVTPFFIGILILTPVGMVDFYYSGGPILHGAILYGLIGALIGIFNGGFVQWPPQSGEKRFQPRHALVGLLLTFFVWFSVGLTFGLSLVDSLKMGGTLALLGGGAGGFWRFLNYEPSLLSDEKHVFSRKTDFSLRRGLIGLILGFLSACVPGLILGHPLEGLIIGLVLALVGSFAGAFWNYLSWEPQPIPEISWSKFAWPGGLIGVVPGIMLGLILRYPLNTRMEQSVITAEFLSLAGFIAFGLWPWPSTLLRRFTASFQQVFHPPLTAPVGVPSGVLVDVHPEEPAAKARETSDSPLAVQVAEETGASPTEAQVATTEEKKPVPPLFSARGFLLGLGSALVLALIWASTTEFFFHNSVQNILGASLSAMAFIGPAGAITGAFSRFLFWRADSQDDDALLGQGALITLLGFFLQLLPPLANLVGIQSH